MAKKNNKRRHNRTVELKRQVEQEKLTEEKDRARKRMDPTARMLLYADIVFLAVFAVLDSRGGRRPAPGRPVVPVWTEGGRPAEGPQTVKRIDFSCDLVYDNP